MTAATAPTLTLRGQLVAALHEESDLLGHSLTVDESVNVVVRVVDTLDLHDHSECECTAEHCQDPTAHDSQEHLLEALQALHAQAHNTNHDSLYPENCRREPCASVA
jgi:hypothetical protein